MNTHQIVGCILIVLGLMMYLKAYDVVTSLPGNILFFGGVMTLTWGLDNPVARVFFALAAFSMLFVLVGLFWIVRRARSNSGSLIPPDL